MLMLIKNWEANMVLRDFPQLNFSEIIKTTHKIIMEKEMLMLYQIICRVKLEKPSVQEAEVEVEAATRVEKIERSPLVPVVRKMM